MIFRHISDNLLLPLIIATGVLVGITGYTLYMSRAHSYLSDKPSACINCHIMVPYYQSWQHSSHGIHTNCNDCHVPHNNVFAKYAFKAKDGLYHASVFTLKAEPQVIRPKDASHSVIMENCIRCHTQLNTAYVKTGMVSFAETKKGIGKACWDCHTNIPHTKVSNLASSPWAIVELPASPIPDWLKKMID